MTFFDIHTHTIKKEKNVLSIVSGLFFKDDNLYSIGIHPWHIEDNYPDKLKILDSIVTEPNVLAIGEIGLDKVCKTDFELQKKIFLSQLALAEKYRKPVIIHCVRAFEEVLVLTKNINIPIIIHGFNRGFELAKQLTNRGFFLSFGKSLLDSYPKSQDAFEKSSLNHIFLETDESEFTIKEIYKQASIIKKLEPETLALHIELNFRKVFNGAR